MCSRILGMEVGECWNMWIICSWQCVYKNLQLKKMQNLFQCGALHLKFSYISPHFKGEISFFLCHHTPAQSEKESMFIFPLPDFFFFHLACFQKQKVNREGWNCSWFLFIGKHTEKETYLIQTFASTSFVTLWHISLFGNFCYFTVCS